MKNNRLKFIFITCVFLLTLSSCDSYTGVEGHVLDEKGNAVGEAKIEVDFDGNKKETTTNETGFYSVSEAHFPLFLSKTIKINVSKSGFQMYEQKIVSKENPRRIKHDIVLRQE